MKWIREASLLRRLREGEHSAAERFVANYHGRIYRFLLAITRSREDAEDFTQQTFVAAFKAAGQFRGDSSLSTWLHSIAYREFIGSSRSAHASSRLVDEYPAVDAYAEATEAMHLLDALIDMGTEVRDTFILRKVQGFSVREVSEIMNVAEGTVKSRLHHAKLKLRAAFENAGGSN